MKRPKLTSTGSPASEVVRGELKKQTNTGALYYEVPRHTTLKLPSISAKARPEPKTKAKDNSVYVKGESPISYDDLATPEVAKQGKLGLIITSALVLLTILGGACYYLFVLHNVGH